MGNENNQIVQRSAVGSQTTQIGIQNNSYGISPEEASKIAINLFMENFPKLQNLAAEIARKRADEFCAAAIEKLKSENVQDFSAFADPDVQFVLYQAQRDYARMGTEELLAKLTSMLSMRIVHDHDFILKATLDKAIAIAPYLLPKHYDLLAVYFLVKHVKDENVKTLQDLQEHLNRCSAPFNQACIGDSEYLFSQGCLQTNFGDVVYFLSKCYDFEKEDMKQICPPILYQVHEDFGLSHPGKILAMTHFRMKMGLNIDFNKWIY